MGEHHEEIQATQTMSQKIAEVAGEAHLTCLEDVVPKPYQGFKDIFTKESFDKLPEWKKLDHVSGSIPRAKYHLVIPTLSPPVQSFIPSYNSISNANWFQ